MNTSVCKAQNPTLRLLVKANVAEQNVNHANDNFILLKSLNNGFYEKIWFDDIVMVKSSGNYSTIFTSYSKPYFTSKTLKHWEEILKLDKSFLRTHASFLINKYHITSVDKKSQKLQLLHGFYASVSRRIWGSVLKNISINTNLNLI